MHQKEVMQRTLALRVMAHMMNVMLESGTENTIISIIIYLTLLQRS